MTDHLGCIIAITKAAIAAIAVINVVVVWFLIVFLRCRDENEIFYFERVVLFLDESDIRISRHQLEDE